MADQTIKIKSSSSQIIDEYYDLSLEIVQPHYVYGYGYGYEDIFNLSDGQNIYTTKTYPNDLDYFNVLNVAGLGLGAGLTSTKSDITLSLGGSADFMIQGISYPMEANGRYIDQGINLPSYFSSNSVPIYTYNSNALSGGTYYIHENGEYVMQYLFGVTYAFALVTYLGGIVEQGNTILEITHGAKNSTSGFPIPEARTGVFDEVIGEFQGDPKGFDIEPDITLNYGWGYEASPFLLGDLSDTATLRATVTKDGSAVSGVVVKFDGGPGLTLSANSATTDVNGEADITVSVDSTVLQNLDWRGGNPFLTERFNTGLMELFAEIEEIPSVERAVYTIRTLEDSFFGNEVVSLITIPASGYSYSYGLI